MTHRAVELWFVAIAIAAGCGEQAPRDSENETSGAVDSSGVDASDASSGASTQSLTSGAQTQPSTTVADDDTSASDSTASTAGETGMHEVHPCDGLAPSG